MKADENDISMDVEGIFFGVYNTSSEGDQPSQGLTIKKEDLDRSSGEIVGRYAWKNTSGRRLAAVCKIELDGRLLIEDDGSNILANGQEGKFDTILFRYPGTAWANRLGEHRLKVYPGYRNTFQGGPATFQTDMPPCVYFEPREFVIRLV